MNLEEWIICLQPTWYLWSSKIIISGLAAGYSVFLIFLIKITSPFFQSHAEKAVRKQQ